MTIFPRTSLRRARTTALASALLLGLGVVPGLLPTGAAAAETTPTVKTGVYRGAGGWGANAVPAYESFVGKPVDYGLDFQATDTWDNQAWPGWQADAWKGRTVVLGATGIFPGGWDRTFNGTRVGWSQAAAGEYDAHWRRLGERLVATGQSAAVLRGAHEFNGGWFAHRVHPEEAPAFTAAWRRWVTIMRAVPGQSFSFDWNPTLGNEWPLYQPEIAYPGDAYVDRIALDVYDGWYNRGWAHGGAQPTTAERDEVWNRMLNGERGLRFWRDFSIAHGKRMSLPEWGLRLWKEDDGLVHGGGDNAVFVQRMAALIKDPAWRIDYHAFWEDPGQGVVDPDASGRAVAVPNARAAFLAAFGPGSTTPVPVVPAPAPSPSVTPPAPAPSPTTAPSPVAPAPVVPSPTASPAPQPALTVGGLSCTKRTVTTSATALPLLFSRWSDRSWAAELSGKTVSGELFAWVPTAGVKEVSFRIDRGAYRVDREAPFDLVGGNTWWGEPLRTSTLTKGKHTIEVTASKADGCLVRTVSFTVS